MNDLIQLTSRNIKVYLRDRMSVFFSFLSVIIIITLYALFLGDMQAKSIESAVGSIDGIRFMVDSWIIAGIIVINSITTTLGALYIMVKDRQNNTFNDFISSPISRIKIMLSYLISSILIGFILTIVAFIIGEFYIVMSGGYLLNFVQILKIVGLILLSITSFSSMLFFIATFLKSENAFGGFSTIIGTFIGFLMGIYIPIGVLGEKVQTVIAMFIPSYMAVALRQIFMEKPLQMVFNGAPAKVLNEYKDMYGVTMNIFGLNITVLVAATAVLIMGLVFSLLALYRLKKCKSI